MHSSYSEILECTMSFNRYSTSIHLWSFSIAWYIHLLSLQLNASIYPSEINTTTFMKSVVLNYQFGCCMKITTLERYVRMIGTSQLDANWDETLVLHTTESETTIEVFGCFLRNGNMGFNSMIILLQLWPEQLAKIRARHCRVISIWVRKQWNESGIFLVQSCSFTKRYANYFPWMQWKRWN